MAPQGIDQSRGQPVVSTMLALTQLMAVPANRSCADCQSTLVDASQVHASFSPSVVDVTPVSRYNNFRLNHQSFAPPGAVSISIPEAFDPPMDPALFAAQRAGGGHGVFVCALCGAAHKLLGSGIAIVHAVQDPIAWTPEKVQLLAQAGGNQKSRAVYEYYMPHGWKAKRPKPESSIGDRLSFIRAKYEALAFVLPPSGPLAPMAWSSIVDRHHEWEGLWEANLHTLSELELQSMSQSSFNLSTKRLGEPPNRLVDFFCVVEASDFMDPAQRNADLSKLLAPDDFLLAPRVSDCFPKQDSFPDVEFPEHVSTFVCPEGCRPSLTKVPPSFFTFVLTGADGDHMYGAVLRLYDEHRDVGSLRKVMLDSGYTGKLPSWLTKSSAKNLNATQHSDVIFLPKCLVLLSHYPFFDLWRKFLLKIYRIVLVEAPLPIERFIANFVCEVPLPPPGHIQVRFGFTVKDVWSIQRPAENQLPLANFSYRPLFASLSIANVMVVMGSLMQETRVALVSRHYALLGPVAEALLSLLFPFHWQGLYLPVMPYSVQDILDAPIPFLVGLHSRYLVETPAHRRPQGVVFVDLDRDVVHLGFDDDTASPRQTPSLPERHALKLKSKLDEVAACVYLRPDTGKAGSVTTASGAAVPYAERDSYAHITSMEIPDTPLRRKDVFGNIDKAYRDNELLFPLSGFLSEQGQLYERDVDSQKAKTDPKFKFLRRSRHANASFDDSDDGAYDNILDMTEPAGFSSVEIRNAFLRFFVSMLRTYRQFMDHDTFRSSDFLVGLNVSDANADFVGHVLKSQMFSRFLAERRENPTDPEVVFFDESITAKVNRSKKTALTNMGRGGKRGTTAFIDDKSAMVTDTFAPPPPSNWGLPDDGRCYQYGSFPELNEELFGKIRPPMHWPQKHRKALSLMARRGSIAVQEKERFVLAKAMAPVVHTPGVIYSATKRGVKNLETAITALSSPFSSPLLSSRSGQSERSRFRHRRGGKSDKTQKADQSPPRHSLALSEVTLPSDVFGMDADMSMSSTAEELVLNARRKQAILLAIIIKLQTVCRMYLAKNHSRQRQGAEKKPPTNASKDDKAQTGATTHIQCFFRGYRARRRFGRMRSVVVCLQARERGRRVRFAFRLLMRAFSRVQALARGFIARMRLSLLFEQRMETYRQQIVLLWQGAHTPLCYRSKFWPLVKKAGFLRVGIVETELTRLWKELGIDTPSFVETNGLGSDKALRLGRTLGVNCITHAKCLKIASATTPSANGILDGVPSRKPSKDIDRAILRETAERIQIYERLSMSDQTDQKLLGYLDQFKLSAKEKKKKLALSEAIWRKADLADQSASFMLLLFPELRDSTNIYFIRPSQKGLRRFRSQDLIPNPLDRAMWAHTLLDERIRRNLREVAAAGMSMIPVLFAKLSTSNGKGKDHFSRRIQSADNSAEWERCRLELMREFFSDARRLTRKKVLHPTEFSESQSSRSVTGGSLQTDNAKRAHAVSLPGNGFWVNDKGVKENLPGEAFWESAADKENAHSFG